MQINQLRWQGSTQSVVIQIKNLQLREETQLSGDRPGESIGEEVKINQRGQLSELGWNGSCQLHRRETHVSQGGHQAQLSGDCSSGAGRGGQIQEGQFSQLP